MIRHFTPIYQHSIVYTWMITQFHDRDPTENLQANNFPTQNRYWWTSPCKLELLIFRHVEFNTTESA